MKKVMILGGGVNQLGLLRAGKALGYEVLLCDKNPACPGRAEADRFFCVDIIDTERVYETARDAEIDGIVANTEAVMEVVAEVSTRLGLMGNPRESIAVLQSKSRFRDFQQKAGLFAPQHRLIGAVEELAGALEGLRYPVIVKPAQCSGTRGTTRFDHYDEAGMRQVVEECIRFSRNNLCDLEEYVDMPSLMVLEGDILVDRGQIYWGGLFFTKRSEASPMIPMTYLIPYDDTPAHMTAIRNQLTHLIRELGIVHGEYNVEAYFDGADRFFIIEINARQGGNGLPGFVSRATGVSMDQLLVSTAMGDHTLFEAALNGGQETCFDVWHTIFSQESGRYQGLFVSPEIRGYVQRIEEHKQPGDEVEKVVNGSCFVGFASLRFPDRETQHFYGEQVDRYIRPILAE